MTTDRVEVTTPATGDRSKIQLEVPQPFNGTGRPVVHVLGVAGARQLAESLTAACDAADLDARCAAPHCSGAPHVLCGDCDRDPCPDHPALATRGFRITVAGRLLRVTVLESFVAGADEWCPVDVRDTATGIEAQAIVIGSRCWELGDLLGDDGLQDAIRSVFTNIRWTATARHDAATGPELADGFAIEYHTYRHDVTTVHATLAAERES